jgi:glycosyltransferase involved in cell wall biosynthesis
MITYTLPMFAANALRRAGNRLRESGAPREGSSPRVVVVSNVPSFGGGGVVGFRDMLLALREMRPDVERIAVCPQKGDVAAECTRQGDVTTIAWTPWWSFGKWPGLPGIHALLGWLPYSLIIPPGIVQAVLLFRRLRPAMVLSNTMTIPSHAIAAKLLGIPHYWMVREFGRDDHRLWFLLGYHRTIRLIDRLSETVICNSHAVEAALLGIAPQMRTQVLYPVVETPLATPPERQPGERMRALLVGYFSQSKGQPLAIKAIAIARRAGVDIELTLIGAGSDKPLRRLAQRLGVEDLLSIHEPTRDLAPHWAAAHVGLMCSEREAFGRVTVEAMRAGLPVCGTNSGGTAEIIEPGVNGLISPAGDAEALAANLMALESDDDLRRSLALRAADTTRRYQRRRHDDQLVRILGLLTTNEGRPELEPSPTEEFDFG